jgi:hypothetical protein
VQAALPKLHAQSLVVFDDTPWQGGAWIGKGALAVPRLLAQGWPSCTPATKSCCTEGLNS